MAKITLEMNMGGDLVNSLNTLGKSAKTVSNVIQGSTITSIKTLNVHTNDCQKQLDALNRKYEQSIEKVRTVSDKYAQAQKRNAELVSKLKRVSTNTKELNDYKRIISTLLRQIKVLELSYNLLQKRLDKTDNKLQKQTATVHKLKNSFTDLKNNGIKEADVSFAQFAAKITTINAGINTLKSMGKTLANLFIEPSKQAGTFEIMTSRLIVAMKDYDKGMQTFESLKKFARTIPFSVEQVVDSAVMFTNAGLDENQVENKIRQLSAMSGGDKSVFDRMATNYMQIRAAGTATARDLREFANAGIPVYNVLKQLGVQGTATAEDIDKAFDVMTSKGGLFYGTIQAYSKTFNGMLNNLQDAWQQFKASIGEFLLPMVKMIMISITNILNGITTVINYMRKIIPDDLLADMSFLNILFGTFSTVLLGKAISALPIVIKLMSDLKTAIKFATIGLSAMFKMILANPIVAIIALIIGALVALSIKFEGVAKVVGKVVGVIVNTLKIAFLPVLKVIQGIVKTIDFFRGTNLSERLKWVDNIDLSYKNAMEKGANVATNARNAIVSFAEHPLKGFTNPNGTIRVSDENLVELADDFRQFLNEESLRRFNISFQRVAPIVEVGGVNVNNGMSGEEVVNAITSAVESVTTSSVGY